MAWLSDWKKRIKLIVDHTKIDEDLTDFPVMLNLNNYNAKVLFDEVDYSSVDDDFTAVNGSVPNNDRWDDLSTNGFTIQGNRLYNVADAWELLRSRWTLSGDFDIQVDFDASNAPTTDGWYSRIYIRNSDSSIKQFMAINYTSGYKYASNYYDGGWGSEQKVVTTDTTGKFRVVRHGSIITCYTWNGSGWDSRLARTYSSAPDIIVDFINGIPSGSTTFYFDNFKVNSGTICWPQGTHPNRKKVAITEEDGVTQCYAEIEHFDNNSKNIILWAKVPTVVSGSNTAVYMYTDVDKPDNTTYVGDIASTPAQNVWDENFVGVWHMNQDPTGGIGAIKDSTVSGSHGTASGTMTYEDLVDGKIGKALEFNGADECIGCGDASILTFDYNEPYTMEHTAKLFDTEAGDALLSNMYTGSGYPGYDIGISGDNRLVAHLISSWDTSCIKVIQTTGDLADGNHHYCVVTYNGNTYASGMLLYVEGISVDTNIDKDNLTTTITYISDFMIGSRNASSSFFKGVSDETRISNIARSAPWIKATYYSNWDDLIVYEPYYQLYKYYFAGYTFEDSVPVSRIVRAYVSSTGRLTGEVTSSGNGYYQLHVSVSGSHYLVCMDADELPDYNNLIISRAIPYVNE